MLTQKQKAAGLIAIGLATMAAGFVAPITCWDACTGVLASAFFHNSVVAGMPLTPVVLIGAGLSAIGLYLFNTAQRPVHSTRLAPQRIPDGQDDVLDAVRVVATHGEGRAPPAVVQAAREALRHDRPDHKHKAKRGARKK